VRTAADQALDCRFGHDESLGDLAVGESAGDEAEHLASLALDHAPVDRDFAARTDPLEPPAAVLEQRRSWSSTISSRMLIWHGRAARRVRACLRWSRPASTEAPRGANPDDVLTALIAPPPRVTDGRRCETRTPVDDPTRYMVQPIGVVRSSLRALADAPNQALEGAPDALLEIDPTFIDALHRIGPGDALIVLTWLHLADRDVLQTHPTGDTNIPLTGVFRTRSPDRPNPIGVHRVRITALEGPTRLRVEALEAIDGTPIIDLKIAMGGSPEA
jgi:tRNA-Thr(GGU) m(6)t(6)A37 methyltransferase TsaA